jgi:hypothetical protein
MTNILAYWRTELITAVNSVISLAPAGTDLIKPFSVFYVNYTKKSFTGLSPAGANLIRPFLM